MKPQSSSALAFALAITGAVAQIPPEEFALPVSSNNSQLGVAFTVGGDTQVVEPGSLFGGDSE